MNELYMNSTGEMFTVAYGVFQPVDSTALAPQAQQLANALGADPYQSYFKKPFRMVAYGKGDRFYGEFPMTPGDFNPGSVFDACAAVRRYVRDGEVSWPRLYLYPTSVCDSHCALCQFHDRHSEATALAPDQAEIILGALREHSDGVHAQTLIISGDGEPATWPSLPELLGAAGEAGLRVYLTTNLRKPFTRHQRLYEAMAKDCAMITVSVKGLSGAEYARQQGVSSDEEFERVISNLEQLISLRREYGRQADCLIGVASLILPGNAPYYAAMIERLHAMGVDYFHVNQVEPSLDHWGIGFTTEERAQIAGQFGEYAKNPHTDMTVRCPGDPFEQAHGDTVYFDAAKLRLHPGVCGSALFNPLVLSAGGQARWLSCRNSDLFADPAYSFTPGVASSVAGMMQAAAGCHKCRLERQVKHFDKIIDIEMMHRHDDLDFYLVFDLDALLAHDQCVTHFENVLR